MQPIQTSLKLEFTKANADVSESLLPDLLSFSYSDKETDEADEISITLKDDEGKWAGTWQPNAGEIVRAFILSGTVEKQDKKLYCGKFYVDSMSVAGSPRTFELKAVSIPLNKPIRRKLKSKAWEKKTLKAIAEEIANEAEIKFIFDSEINPEYDRQEQNRESDMKFLSRLCEEEGLSIKLTDEQLVIFDQSFYESKPAVQTLELGVSDILSWSFESSQSETFKSCSISYRDPKQKKKGEAGGQVIGLSEVKKSQKNAAVMTYTYVDPNADENGQEYAIKKRAKSIDDAKRLAKAKLRKLNMRRVTGNITVLGDVSLVAGLVIKCVGFGAFDGNFIIETAEHTIGSGYVTALSLRRVNNDY